MTGTSNSRETESRHRVQWPVEVVLILALLVAGMWFGVQVRRIWLRSSFTDFALVWTAARHFSGGAALYDVEGLRAHPFGSFYKYPPFVGVFLAPFASMPAVDAARGYVVVCLVLYVLTFFLIVRVESFVQRSLPFYLLAIGMLVFQPALDTLFGAQHECLLLFLFAVAYSALVRPVAAQMSAGACLGFAAIVKLYPLLFLIGLAVQRYWRACLALIATFAALTVLSAATAGWSLERHFYVEVLPILSGATAWLENQSIAGFFGRLFVDGARVDPSVVSVGAPAVVLAKVAGVMCLALSGWTLRSTKTAADIFTILIPLALLITPDAWIHYETVLLLPFGILLGDVFRNFSAGRAATLAIAFGLLAAGNEVTMRATPPGLLHSYKFFGVLLFWLIAVRRRGSS